MAIWEAAVAAFRERQNTLAEALENANLLLAAYRRHRAESQDGAVAGGDLHSLGSGEGAGAHQS
jgi:hypothetical protein